MIHKRDARAKCEDLVRYAETGIPSDDQCLVNLQRGLAFGFLDAMYYCDRITHTEHTDWTQRTDDAKGF